MLHVQEGGVTYVLHSMHSSHDELAAFVEAIAPRCLLPACGPLRGSGGDGSGSGVDGNAHDTCPALGPRLGQHPSAHPDRVSSFDRLVKAAAQWVGGAARGPDASGAFQDGALKAENLQDNILPAQAPQSTATTEQDSDTCSDCHASESASPSEEAETSQHSGLGGNNSPSFQTGDNGLTVRRKIKHAGKLTMAVKIQGCEVALKLAAGLEGGMPSRDTPVVSELVNPDLL